MERDFTARGNHDMGGLTAGEIIKMSMITHFGKKELMLS